MPIQEMILSKLSDKLIEQLTGAFKPILSLVKTHRGATIYHKSITAIIQIVSAKDDDTQAPIYIYENKTAEPIAIEAIQLALEGNQGLDNNPSCRIDILNPLGKPINIFEIDDNDQAGNFAPLSLGGLIIDLQANPLYLKPREQLAFYAWELNGVTTYGTVSIRIGAV